MPKVLHQSDSVTVTYVPRSEWGATTETEAYIAGRPQLSAVSRTGAYLHHTAAMDSDDTPNEWSYAAAVAYMRRLQWVRPDLGPLPYPFNVAASEDGRTVWLFEGRGLSAKPAHEDDLGANWWALAWGAFGNFDVVTVEPVRRRILEAVRWHAWSLRSSGGFTNLGNRKNPNGWDLWGHRDSSPKTCPGSGLYSLLVDYPFVDWNPEEPMQNITKDSGPFWISWLQRRLRATVAPELVPDGVWGPATTAAVAATGDATPEVVGGNDWARIEELYVRSVSGGGGDHPHPYAAEDHTHPYSGKTGEPT